MKTLNESNLLKNECHFIYNISFFIIKTLYWVPDTAIIM